MITVNFRTLALEAGVEADLYYRFEEEFEPFTFSHYRPSVLQTGRCDREGNLILFEKFTTAEGGDQYRLFRKVRIPKDSETALILVMQKKDDLILSAIQDNLSEDDKDWLFMNITPSPLIIQLGNEGKPFTVSPGQTLPYRIDFQPGKGVPVRIVRRSEEQWERVYSTFWPIYEGQRTLVICVQNGDRIVVRNFFESVIPVETEESEEANDTKKSDKPFG